MALDDRDRRFEKALALRLRANMPAADCPDAETLAAYHERSLALDKLNSWKSHVASCTNCQQILAHLEALDEIPLRALSEKHASGAVSDLVGAGVVAAVAHDAPSVPPAAQKKAVVVSMGQISKHQRFTYWRWIAPVGAIAAGVLVWVAVHENRPAAILPSAKIEIAKNLPSANEPKPAASAPAEREIPDKATSLSKAVPPAGDRAAASSDLQNRRDMLASKSPAPAPLAGSSDSVTVESRNAQLANKTKSADDAKISGLAGDVATGAAGSAVGGIASRVATPQKEKKFDEPAQQDQAMNYVGAPAPAAPKPQSARQAGLPSQQKDEKQLQANESASAPHPPDELKQPSQDVNAPVAPLPSAAETVTVTSQPAAAPALRVAKSRAPRTVAAPGGKVIWRFGFGGLIEQSLDSGQTWTPQTSGTTENLFLGSAPSEQVCWVISITGTILRTTDGGATWTSVVSPIPQDLGLIRASDALHATVWDMSRRHIFQTSDGGATWTPASAH
jgi:hypothetical protein